MELMPGYTPVYEAGKLVAQYKMPSVPPTADLCPVCQAAPRSRYGVCIDCAQDLKD